MQKNPNFLIWKTCTKFTKDITPVMINEKTILKLLCFIFKNETRIKDFVVSAFQFQYRTKNLTTILHRKVWTGSLFGLQPFHSISTSVSTYELICSARIFTNDDKRIRNTNNWIIYYNIEVTKLYITSLFNLRQYCKIQQCLGSFDSTSWNTSPLSKHIKCPSV